MDDTSAVFTVDTHLFRELGELLVGRDSTALIELIKNSYDADATEVVVLGERLDDPDGGRIVISDNGNGMTSDQFSQGFLRIASRLKESGDRRSARLNRRFTGAKGIGRLAAHKLARILEVASVPLSTNSPQTRHEVHARIDWDEIERFETLDQITGDSAIKVNTSPIPGSAHGGTVLTLARLRRRWTPTERARFFAEVQSFAPPDFLMNPVKRSVLKEPLLFEEPLVRLTGTAGQQFDVRLEGEFAAGDEYWRLMEQHASWVIEIRCRPGDESVHYAIAPTQKMLNEIPDAEPYAIELPHPDPSDGPFFDARIFLRVGKLTAKRDQRTWTSQSSGVRVFMEGFRILPYGDPRNDWLRLDADYTRRSRTLETLKTWGMDNVGPDVDEDKDADLTGLPNNNYFGGIFLVHDHARNLRTLVNREGFIPEGGYDHLVLLVRTGIDLCTRVHAAATFQRRQERKKRRREPQKEYDGGATPKKNQNPNPTDLKKTLEDTVVALSKVRAEVAAGAGVEEAQEITTQLAYVIGEIEEETKNAEELISEQSLLRVLASVGTQMAAFIHEINALLGASQSVERALARILTDAGLNRSQMQELSRVAQAVGELRRGLEREASYLTDIVTPDARRRRSRQRLAERFGVAARLVAHHAERRDIRIENDIPEELKSPPMFPAEIMAVFTNLLTNAVKAAGPGGTVQATARLDEERRVCTVVQNTGDVVKVETAERWFRPFESTTSKVDPVLGQGMGLGLPITRRVLEDYGAVIRFVEPKPGFSSAVEIVFPN